MDALMFSCLSRAGALPLPKFSGGRSKDLTGTVGGNIKVRLSLPPDKVDEGFKQRFLELTGGVTYEDYWAQQQARALAEMQAKEVRCQRRRQWLQQVIQTALRLLRLSR